MPEASKRSELPTDSQLEVLDAITKDRVLRTYSTPEGVGKAHIETGKGKVVTTVRRLIADACLRREWLEQAAHTENAVLFKLSAAGVTARNNAKKAKTGKVPKEVKDKSAPAKSRPAKKPAGAQ